MTIEDFVDLAGERTGGTPKKTGGGYAVRCPAHEDKRASLSVGRGVKGIVLKCHAGCDAKAICASLGVKLKDLFDDVSKGKAPAPRPSPPVGAREKKSPAPPKAASAAASRERWKIVAAYDYKDERGKLLYQVVRMDPKDFRQRRPDGKGGWIWSLGDVRRVLYRLPEVIKEAKGGGTVYVVEGEKDADAIVLFKLCATCNCGGAGKWLADYAKAFTGAARVVIIADKDEPGRKHAVKVAEAVSELVKDVRVIECPDVGAIKVRDAADFFAAGGSAADLKAIVEAAKPFATATAEARPVISAEKPPELPPAVYEPERGRFHVPTPAGDWMPIPESSVMVRLRRAGFRVYLKDANGVTETEHAKERIMDERNVGYAGEIAGYAPGMKLICGRRFLVTSGPKLIEGRPGAWPRIEKVLQQWFGADAQHGERQFWTVFGWLGAAHRALVSGMATGQFGPGQALFLTGEGGVGKSVFQLFVAKLPGGRVADPSRFLVGNEFTRDIIGAEHNAIEDTATARDIDSRRNFGQALKNLVVNQSHSLHGKGANAITVTRFCRVTVSLNNQPQDLMVLPELSGGVVDKISILKMHRAELPDLQIPAVVAEFWDVIAAELPAFLHALATTKLPPLVLGCDTARRYGVASWRHPEIAEQVQDLSPWRRLVELIDHALPWADGLEPEAMLHDSWTGTTAALESLLIERRKDQASRCLRGLLSTGRDLSAFAENCPARIRKFASMGHTKWELFPPK